jgi:hypothetical protein
VSDYFKLEIFCVFGHGNCTLLRWTCVQLLGCSSFLAAGLLFFVLRNLVNQTLWSDFLQDRGGNFFDAFVGGG